MSWSETKFIHYFFFFRENFHEFFSLQITLKNCSMNNNLQRATNASLFKTVRWYYVFHCYTEKKNEVNTFYFPSKKMVTFLIFYEVLPEI